MSVIKQSKLDELRQKIWLLEKGAAMLGHSNARRAMRTDWDSALEGVGQPGSTPPEPPRRHRIWINEEHDAYMTDAPPEPGYDEWQNGTPDQAGYARYLMIEENDALLRYQQSPQLSPWQEQARRRTFGMESATSYQPEDADAWQAQQAEAIAQEAEAQAEAQARTQTLAGQAMSAPAAPREVIPPEAVSPEIIPGTAPEAISGAAHPSAPQSTPSDPARGPGPHPAAALPAPAPDAPAADRSRPADDELARAYEALFTELSAGHLDGIDFDALLGDGPAAAGSAKHGAVSGRDKRRKGRRSA